MYVNFVIIIYFSLEFIVDFVCVMLGLFKVGVQLCIVLIFEYVKCLMYVLQENVVKYECNFGFI